MWHTVESFYFVGNQNFTTWEGKFMGKGEPQNQETLVPHEQMLKFAILKFKTVVNLYMFIKFCCKGF
jgi:hypothetical protein